MYLMNFKQKSSPGHLRGMNGTLLLLLNPRIRAGPPQLSELLDGERAKKARSRSCVP